MRGSHNPGSAAQYVILPGNSPDGQAHGGRNLPSPPSVHRRVQVRSTDHPATDRWVRLTTARAGATYLFVVGVVDGHNRPVSRMRKFPTLRRARNAANKLYRQLTEENKQ